MTKKVIIITGANSGIGKAAAVQVARDGHQVVMACRNPQKGEAALLDVKQASGSQTVTLMVVDMSLKSSIRAFAQDFLAQYDHLDVLIHNAAIFDITQKQAVFTSEGVESVWATNHVGPVLMTDLLLDALKRSPQGRILTVASKGLLAKPFLRVNLADPELKKTRYSVEKAYYQSKLAQIMYTLWLAERLQGDGITVNCIRVPSVRVDMAKYANLPAFMLKAYELKSRSALSPEEMAEVYAYLAADESLDGVTGQYFDEKKQPVAIPGYAEKPENIQAVMELTQRYL